MAPCKLKSCWRGTMINGVLSWPPRLLLKPDLSSLPMSASPESCLLLLILNNSCKILLLIGPRCGLSLHLSETDSVYPDDDVSVARSVISSNFCFSRILSPAPNLNKVLQKNSWLKSYWTQMSSITLLVRNWLSIPCLWNISGEILADSEPDGDVNMGLFINDVITWGVGGVGGRPKDDEWWHDDTGVKDWWQNNLFLLNF